MSQKRGCCSGGAGGTFASINGRRNPLIIAGGGGGTRGYEEDDPDGQPGNLEVFESCILKLDCLGHVKYITFSHPTLARNLLPTAILG